MQRAAETSRFLIDLSSGGEFADSESLTGRDSLLQRLVVSGLAHAANSRELFNQLGNKLIRLAEHAYSLRDANTLQKASQVLMNLPTASARQVGQYYQALAARQNGRIDEALSLLETVADDGPVVYRARAIQALGAIYHRQGRHDEALRLYPEALRVASRDDGRDLLTTLLVVLEISCIKSEIGDHRGALADYESLSPLVRIVARENPVYFYGYHNELAIEFDEFGRTAEAEAACAIALASPFAPAYPEWSATRDEIAAKRRSATPSIVAVNRAPETEHSVQAQPKRQSTTSKALALSQLASDKASFQRSIIPIPETATNPLSAISILERVLICIGPRAPPTDR
jgi:tetratricopeptide (TPR) repeat protein